MKHLFFKLVVAAAATVALAAPASAQSDILLRLRSGSPLGDRFRVDSAGGFVARGSLGIGIIPQTGAGERVMWYPFKSSFRAGGVDGSQWDDANTGFYSLAAGFNTTAQGNYSVAIGYASKAVQSYGVALGYTANADGTSAVSIGYRTTADADYSLAMGYRASTAGRTGAMVFSDASTTDSTRATANNQVTVRAAGGTRLFTNATMTAGVQLSAGGSSWAVISDRNRKENFAGVDGEDVLLRLRSVPVTTWQYRDEEERSTRHIGPMAQDWHRAFGFTTDATTINMSDFDGVNLVAVQALEARTASQAQEIQALQGRVAERDARIETLEARIARLEALLAAPQPPR